MLPKGNNYQSVACKAHVSGFIRQTEHILQEKKVFLIGDYKMDSISTKYIQKCHIQNWNEHLLITLWIWAFQCFFFPQFALKQCHQHQNLLSLSYFDMVFPLIF